MKAKLTLEFESPINGEIISKHIAEGIFSEEDLINLRKMGIDVPAHILDVMSKKIYEILKNKTN